MAMPCKNVIELYSSCHKMFLIRSKNIIPLIDRLRTFHLDTAVKHAEFQVFRKTTTAGNLTFIRDFKTKNPLDGRNIKKAESSDSGNEQQSAPLQNTNMNNPLPFQSPPNPEKPSTEEKTLKPPPIIRFMILDTDAKIIGHKTKDEAQKMAEGRGLKLVKIQDSLNQAKKASVYQLMSTSQLARETVDSKRKSQDARGIDREEPGEKVLMLTSKIGEHDLKCRVKAINGWLKKGLIVKVTITGDQQNSGNVVKIIEGEIQDLGRVLQKRQKDAHMKFTLQPNSLTKKGKLEAATAKQELNQSN